MRRREFLQGIAAAALAGLPVDAPFAADPADNAHFYDALKPFGNVGLLHFTDCHAQLLPIRFREPSVNLGVGRQPRQAAAPRRRGAAQAFRHRAGVPRRPRVHVSRFRARIARVRRDGWLRAPRDAGEAPARRPARRAAARRRRHLAGLGDLAVDARPGHGRRGEASRRRRDDRRTGSSPTAPRG